MLVFFFALLLLCLVYQMCLSDVGFGMKLQAALLAKDNVISQNAKSYLKELALRRDDRLIQLLAEFESKQTDDAAFLESIHTAIGMYNHTYICMCVILCHVCVATTCVAIEAESEVLYRELFHDTPTDVGKALSREERQTRSLEEEKSLIYGEVGVYENI